LSIAYSPSVTELCLEILNIAAVAVADAKQKEKKNRRKKAKSRMCF